MPLPHGQGNLGGEARGNYTDCSPRDSHLSGRKRKPVLEEAEMIHRSQQGEWSYTTFTPDDSDGEATSLSAIESRDDYHVLKKYKPTTQGLLSGTAMEDLCVEIPPRINSPSMYPMTLPTMTGDQHLGPGQSKSSSTSSRAPPVRRFVNDCIGNTASAAPKEKCRIEAQAQAGLAGNSSDETHDALDSCDNVTEDSFVFVASDNDSGSQLLLAHTDFAPPSLNPIPATRSQTTRPSPKHEGERAPNMSDLEVAEYAHERSTRDGLKDLNAQSQDPGFGEAGESGKRMMPAGAICGPAMPENDAKAPTDSRSKPDDREYEFVEHPEPRRIQKFRELAAYVKGPDGVAHPVIVKCDNWADSNFISSILVESLGFKERPLVGKDIVTYNTLIGPCTPQMYVPVDMKPRGVSEYYRESFRVVVNDDFELIVGAATIEKRGIPLQEQAGGSALPSFKKEPTKQQAAAQKASRNQDRQTALELSKNIPPVIQGSLSAKDDLRNSPNSSTRTSTNSTIASGSTLKSSSSTSSKTRQKG